MPRSSSITRARAAYNHLREWVHGRRGPWISPSTAAILLGVSSRAVQAMDFPRSRQTPWVGRPGRAIHIWPIWQRAVWCTREDCLQHFAISEATWHRWTHRGYLHPVRGHGLTGCVSYYEVLRLELLCQVKELLGGPRVRWDEVDVWVRAGTETLLTEVARRSGG